MVVQTTVRWNEQDLEAVPRHGGFRLRGLDMTRLEAFTDAAFAFATTMLVISLSGIPNGVDELIAALRDIPAFLASFASITSFWYAHRQWSRRYGLEDGLTTLISLLLIFVMLIFVYPLKMMFSAMFAWISGGWLPTSFTLHSGFELLTLFVVYGLGFAAVNGLMSLLYLRALKAGEALALSPFERVKTREDITTFAVVGATGLTSALAAWLLPPRLGIWAGFCYMTLPITMALVVASYAKKAKQAQAAAPG